MSIEPIQVRELLSGLYVERDASQWKTVANCIEDILLEQVVSYSGLAAVALDLAEKDSSFYDDLMRRAQKLNNRFGKPGHLEAQRLARASLELSLTNKIKGYQKLAAHTSRIGFNREHKDVLATLVETASTSTQTSIDYLSKNKRFFSKVVDPIEAVTLLPMLEERDNHIHENFCRSDEIHARTLACITSQACPWETVNFLIDHSGHPYPYANEFHAARACLSVVSDGVVVELLDLPVLPKELLVKDTINYPLLSLLTFKGNNEEKMAHANKSTIPLSKFAQQIMLEIIFLRQERS